MADVGEDRKRERRPGSDEAEKARPAKWEFELHIQTLTAFFFFESWTDPRGPLVLASQLTASDSLSCAGILESMTRFYSKRPLVRHKKGV